MKTQSKINCIPDFHCQYICKMHGNKIFEHKGKQLTYLKETQNKIYFKETKTSEAEKNSAWISDAKNFENLPTLRGNWKR